LGLGTAWAPGFTGQIDGITIELTDGSVANVNLEAFPPPALTINADQTCYNNGIGDTLTLTIDMSEMPGIEIVGAQLFLNYDDAVLQLDSVTPGPDFALEIL